jgi:hypothetical protein
LTFVASEAYLAQTNASLFRIQNLQAVLHYAIVHAASVYYLVAVLAFPAFRANARVGVALVFALAIFARIALAAVLD